MSKITPGNIDEVKAASQERLELILLRKDFSEEGFFRINLTNARISKCVFIKAKFIVNEYKSCEFISCDFTGADFLNVKFNDCTFHGCTFNQSILQEVEFIECSILSCSFDNIELKDSVTGLNEKDLKIIHEEIELNELDLLEIGFQKDDDETFLIQSNINDGPKVELAIVKDSEMGDDIYRILFMVNDESILSDTFDVKEAEQFSEIEELIKSILLLGGRKVTLEFFNNDSNQFELYKSAYTDIKNKLCKK